ncbi:1-acyl-sn-glycerol-3-phosphate acyltransferase [Mucilaginibacter agri]|uniref:Glycerol acyltransferase n=1 Tax=Mucilaginibacter agri TaxID=2695265 RepID=A0A966DR72_9SPHI|nr:1-acyl-sn-glycerol-3-phosphate acyltransferase [Mucilaginibacter agri]NCD68185.1 glycerol acyltransferase [Mucilaginibacter agri]
MIRPKKNLLISGFFSRYIPFIIGRNFRAVNFNKVDFDPSKSILLLPNHYSWWDGFLMFYLNKLLFKKKFYVMILEATSKKIFFLKYLGGYTVLKGSKDIITSLDYTAELLADPGNLVLMFPQGKLYSNFTDDIVFQNGLSKVIKKAAGQFQTIFAVSFIEYMQYKKPTVDIRLHAYDGDFTDINELTDSFKAYYQSAKLEQSKNVV